MATTEEPELITPAPATAVPQPTEETPLTTGVIEGKTLSIQEIGRRVNIPGNLYGQTNFYIEQSRPYVGDHKLTRYVYFVYMNFVYLLVLFTTFFVAFHVAFAVVMLIINGIFLVFYVQHMYVNIKTMPYVLKQPSVPNHMLNSNNTFLEISDDRFRAVYAVASDAGIGLFVRERNVVHVQIFRERVMTKMRLCVLMSTFFFFSSIIALIYCTAWVIVFMLSVQDSDE